MCVFRGTGPADAADKGFFAAASSRHDGIGQRLLFLEIVTPDATDRPPLPRAPSIAARTVSVVMSMLEGWTMRTRKARHTPAL
jgi:hypothetical protein